MRVSALIIVALIAAACGGAAAVTVAPTAAPTTATPVTATPSAASTSATALAWIVSDTSKATVRVREQLVGVSLPSDAVLTATGAKGSFAVNADGTFAAGSKITFDLTTLASDQPLRDNFVKRDTLSTGQFPTATFVPMTATGLALPLRSSGDLGFTLTGTLTLHGTSKTVTFDVQATRNGSTLTATATADPTLSSRTSGCPRRRCRFAW